MAGFNKFFTFVGDVANKVHNLGFDNLKMVLTDVVPNPSNATLAQITEIPAGNGYPVGGFAVAIQSSAQVNGIYKLIAAANLQITASGGPIAQFHYGILYNNSSPGKSLIAWWDFGSEVNLLDGNYLTVTFDASNGILQLA
jgi:hypothetical protein